VEQFEKYFEVAFPPQNGIRKLRELILTYAMEGRLSSQNENDSAEELLVRVFAEQEKFKSKSNVNFESDLEVAQLPKIPRNWKWVKFGRIASHNTGKTLDSGRNSGKSRKYITTSNLYWNRFDLSDLKEMPIKDEELERCTAYKNDLLIVEGGDAGRAAVWMQDEPICFQNHIHRARFFGHINPFFMYRYLEKLCLTGEIEKFRKGVGIKSLSGKSLAQIPVPLPPVSEQNEIIKIIDVLMSKCDELENFEREVTQMRLRINSQSTNSLILSSNEEEFERSLKFIAKNVSELYSDKQNIDELRKTILNLAYKGRLVRSGFTEQKIADRDLKEFRSELLAKRKVKYKDLVANQDIEKLKFELPIGWHWYKFSEVVFFQEGPGIRNWQFTSDGVKLLNVSNILFNHKLDFNNSDKYISEREFNDTYSHFKIEEGDLLFAGSGGSWGKTAWFEDPGYKVMLNTSTLRLKFFHPGFNPDYLFYFLKTSFFKTQLELQLVGLQPNFGSSHFGKINIPIPPIVEQTRIVSEIRKVMDMCDKLEGLLTQKESSSSLLRNTIASLGNR
jgi:type I restriction enzyme S subunit